MCVLSVLLAEWYKGLWNRQIKESKEEKKSFFFLGGGGGGEMKWDLFFFAQIHRNGIKNPLGKKSRRKILFYV